MFFAVTSYVNGIASILIALFVCLRKRGSILTRLFSFLTLSVAIYSIFLANAVLATSREEALFWMRIEHIGNAFIPTAYLHFALAVIKDTKRWKPVLYVSYLLSFLLVPSVFTNLWIGGVRNGFVGLNYYPYPGPLYALYFFLYCSVFIFTEVVVYLASRRLKGRDRKQAFFVFLTGFLGSAAGAITFLPLYGFEVAPNLNGFVILYVASLAYAIVKHNLLDIEVIIRRTLVFAGLFSFAFGIFAFMTFLTQEFLSAYITGTAGRVLSLAVSVFFIVLVFDPLRTFLVNLTDRFLFQKKYDYRKLLKDASAGIAQIKSLDQLLSLVTHFITMRVRVKNAAVLVHDGQHNYYKLAYSRGYSKTGWLRKGHIFNEQNPLINYLVRERSAIDIERLKEYIETGSPKRKQNSSVQVYDFRAIKTTIDELEAACCVPSFLGDRLLGILVLGEKKSGDFYSDEDLSVLFTIAQESAIAIENARLYDEAINKSKELEIKSNELQAKSDELLGKTVELGRKNVELEHKKVDLQTKSDELQGKTDELEAINSKMADTQTELIRSLNETELTNKRLKETQSELLQAKKRALLAGISAAVGHEIRNPLTPMIGHTYYLIKRVEDAQKLYYESLAPKLTETERERYLTTFSELHTRFSAMQRLEERIKGIVSTLVNLVKERTGKKEEVQLNLVISATLEEVRFQTYWEALTTPTIAVVIPADLPFIHGITQDLQGVFVNLVINSLHAMEKTVDKQIRIEAKTDPDNAKMIRIDFSDNGCGIPKELFGKIFEYGFTTKGEKGTGIGLFSCKDNIERIHGGTVSIKSEVGVGTCFTIRLPVYQGPEGSSEKGDQSSHGNIAHN